MKKNIIYIAFILVAGNLLSSCFPEKAEDALVYKGPTVVEIKNQKLGQLAAVLTAVGVHSTTQTDSSRAVLLNVKGIDTILVQLVGPQRSTPITIPFAVRTVPPTGSTIAVEGTHFNFIPAGVRNVTIPPNSSFGYIQVAMIPNSLPTVGNTRVLSIDLLNSGDVTVNPNYNKFILTLRR